MTTDISIITVTYNLNKQPYHYRNFTDKSKWDGFEKLISTYGLIYTTKRIAPRSGLEMSA